MDARMKRRRLLLLLYLVHHKRLQRVNKRKRSKWVREICLKRNELGEFHSLIQEMRLVDHGSFYKYFHMTPQRFQSLLNMVGPLITRQTTNMRCPVSPEERLAVTLRYLVTGDSLQTIAFSYRLGHSTVCGIVDNTCEVLWNVLSPQYLRPPCCNEDWKAISDGFKDLWDFPHCIGAIDGKHIMMQYLLQSCIAGQCKQAEKWE